MYRKQVRRRRAVLALLMVVSLVLLSSTFSGSSGAVGGIENGLASALGPLQDVASRALKPADDLINWFDETFKARGENADLQTEVNDLRSRLVKREKAVAENEHLKKMLGFQESSVAASYHLVAGRVIGRSPTVWYSTVTLNVGSSDGVQINDPVTSDGYLAGRVEDVTGHTAIVQLITDHKSAVSATALPNGPEGVVEPEAGDPNTLLMDFIANDKKVKEGDILVTAGWSSGRISSAYPYGIKIGKVTKASPGEQGAFQRVEIDPFADLQSADLMQVMTDGPKRPGVAK